MIRGEIFPSTPYGIIAVLPDRITDKQSPLCETHSVNPKRTPTGSGLHPFAGVLDGFESFSVTAETIR